MYVKNVGFDGCLAVRSVLFTLSGSSFQDVVHSEDHFGGLGGLDQHLTLDRETLGDAKLNHVSYLTLQNNWNYNLE